MGSSSRSEEDEPTSVSMSNPGGGGRSSLLAVDSLGHGGGSTVRPYSPVAETLFRKDLISAMKLPDNEPLTSDDYWMVTDTWKQEWEKGVQVPVRPEELPEPRVSRLANPPHASNRFQFPRKLLCMSRSGVYTPDTHQVTPMALRAEQVCSYDLDDMDQRWLAAFNGERALSGSTTITELDMERAMEEFERQCHEKIHSTLKSNEEADDSDDGVICDVCRTPDSEDCNEMVFCDKCNICVHQACYGITSIPSGPWLCKTCILGTKPKCELCPNRGGAMKSTKSGNKWAHVSCALWIPEVTMGSIEKMEPITKISSIPQSRWNLVCVLCKERVGSCIQCSVKTCKTAYHVTCAIKRGLEMRAIIEDENSDDGVKLRSYCQKHSLNQKRRDSEDSDDDGKKKHMTAEERSLARRQKLVQIECEFYKHVDLNQAAKKIGGSLEADLIDFIFRYWLLKRKANLNKPLLPPRSEEADLLSHNQDTEREKMKKFVALRQDLERVRNLCYMVSRREKLQRSFVKLREQTLAKQLELLADKNCANQMSLLEMSAILEANHGPTIYDRLFSHGDAEVHTENDFEVIVSRISGEIAESSAQIRKDNPYRKPGNMPVDNQNTFSYQRIFSDMSDASETDDLLNLSASLHSKKDARGSKRGSKASGNKASSAKGRKPVTRSDISELSSEEDNRRNHKVSSSKSKKKAKASIFSDSDSEADTHKRQKSPVFRTKAAMKDFSVDALARNRKDKSAANASSLASSALAKASSKANRKRSAGLLTASVSAAVSKAINKAPAKNRAASTDSSSSSSSSSESDDEVTFTKSNKKKSSAAPDKDFYPMIVPERAAARKANSKLKVSHQDRVPVSEVFTFSDQFEAVAASTTKSSKSKKQPPPPLFGDDDAFDSDSSVETSLTSSSKKSKKSKDADLFGFVPERKAAKKASAHLKEGGKFPANASGRDLLLSPKKSPGRPRKKEHIPSLSERIRLSDDSDEEPFPFKSPRGKSPRGRGGAPKSPRKASRSSNHRSSSSQSASSSNKNKQLSEGALAFLSQRTSELDNIFTEFELPGHSGKKSKKEPDKKFKTSEGRPDSGSQSPPQSQTAEPGLGSPGGNILGSRDNADSSSDDNSSSSSSSSSEDQASAGLAARPERQSQGSRTPAKAADPPDLVPHLSPASRPGRGRPGDQLAPARGGDIRDRLQQESTRATEAFAEQTGKKTGPTPTILSPSRSSFALGTTSQESSPGASPPAPPTPGGHSPSPSPSPLPALLDPGRDGKHFDFTNQASPPPLTPERLSSSRSHLGQTLHDQQGRKFSVESKDSSDPAVDFDRLRSGAPRAPGSKAKQTDDSGFDSDEKAQQAAAALLSKESPNKADPKAAKQNHIQDQQQQHGSQQQQQQRQWDPMQMAAQLNQHRHPGSLMDVNPYQQEQAHKEAFYNYMYNVQRQMGMQQMTQQQQQYTLQHMKQLYGQKSFDNFANFDLFAQQLYNNPHYLQQYMSQFYATGGGGKEMQGFMEQLFQQWPQTSQASSWYNQQGSLSGSKASQQQQQSSHKQQSKHSSSHYLSEPQSHSTDDQLRVQNATHPSSQRRSSKESPRQPAQSPRGGGPHFQQAPPGDGPPSATQAEHLPGYPGGGKGHGDATQETVSISKDLLDSVAAVQTIPVWKPPNSERGSPRKTPNDRSGTTPRADKSGPELVRRSSSDRDKSFDDLVKKVESSPSVNKSGRTVMRSETRESQHSDQDYDDMKGGVDYDDFDYEEDDDFKPNRAGKGRGAGGKRGGRGRGRGRSSVASSRGRGRAKAKAKPIDPKALAEVHKAVAGTDYDFEDEFEDDFGEKREPEISLQEMREQTKRQNMILDAKKEDPDEDDLEAKKASVFDMDDDFKPTKATRGGARGRGKAARGRGRPKKPSYVESPVISDQEQDDKSEAKDEKPHPKLPKLKLGALLIKKDSPKGSPKPSKGPKLHRKSSADAGSDEVRVPKLTIKLGPKPEAKKAEPEPEDSKANVKVPENIETPIKTPKETVVNVETKVEVENNDQKKSVPSSPSKKVSKIDMLASKLMDAKSQGSATNDVDSIFGPAGPLDMSSATDNTAVVTKKLSNPNNTTEGKSELDLLQEEMKKIDKTSSVSSKSVMPPFKKSIASTFDDNDSATRSQHLKLKFKRHATTTASSVDTSAAQSAHSLAESASTGGFPRMRKKEILTKYFGEDAYPALPSNGPTSSSMTSSSSSSLVRDHHHHHQPQRSSIKIPKAVESMTSVPTRADYQPQLEARKRKKGLESGDYDDGKGKGGAAKKKKGRGRPAAETDSDYKPKISAEKDNGNEVKKDSGRKTRGKPPKKCLAESPTHETDSGDFKAESMKYAEQMLASFDKPTAADAPKAKGGRGKKRKPKEAPSSSSSEAKPAKTPRLVIKFSKDASSTPAPPAAAKEDNKPKNNGSINAFDFDNNESLGPMVDGNSDPVDKIQKIKIKLN